ncbi:MAG: ABC transporter [Parcubacteria group bacterium GW2011_GWA2_44_12]|nr:MAG: ABC transporter [Parcubacteria group bacterium GW2011_GWA2_44_12]
MNGFKPFPTHVLHISSVMILSINNVCKRFDGNEILSSCCLEIEQGKISVLIGPNGAGKTTLFDIITGFLKPDRGQIFLQEKDITNKPSYQIARLGIARTFQKVRLFTYLTMLDHLLMAQLEQDDFLYKNLIPRKDNPAHIEKANAMMGELRVGKDLYATLVTELSYGQRKLLSLAMAMIKPHRLLLLDEPVAGVNQTVRETIIEQIKKEAKRGDTVLLIEHDMHFISAIADKVFVLDGGSVIAEGSPEEIKQNKRVLKAYLGD